MKGLIQQKYGDVLEAAREGERRCFSGKMWGGHAILGLIGHLILDAPHVLGTAALLGLGVFLTVTSVKGGENDNG